MGEGAPGQGAGYAEYARHEVLQMVGRAGRPQFDTEVRRAGCAWGTISVLGCCRLLAARRRCGCDPASSVSTTKRARRRAQGAAVIMTQRATAARYAELAAGQEAVESCLLDSVAEHLNGEGERL